MHAPPDDRLELAAKAVQGHGDSLIRIELMLIERQMENCQTTFFTLEYF
jgi:hypothetical protein